MKDVSAVYKGYGVKNVSERIKLFYGEEGNVSFKSEVGVGTEVTIRLLEKGKRGDFENV